MNPHLCRLDLLRQLILILIVGHEIRQSEITSLIYRSLNAYHSCLFVATKSYIQEYYSKLYLMTYLRKSILEAFSGVSLKFTVILQNSTASWPIK